MSRYYDYDYDRNCIIGFGSDETETDYHYKNNKDISPNSSQSGDSLPNTNCLMKNMEEIGIYDDDDDDVLYIQHLDPKHIDYNKLKPIEMDVPFLLVSDLIKQQEIVASFGDIFCRINNDRNLWIQRRLTHQSIERMHDFNGSYYNSFGTVILRPNTYHVWRFQILGNSPSIIGIIEYDENGYNSLNGAYFGCISCLKSYSFNTITAQCYISSSQSQHPQYQEMLKNGVLDEPMIIDLKLDLYRGIMSITNNTLKSKHFGKEILLFVDIDITKSYKLALSLLGPETINLF